MNFSTLTILHALLLSSHVLVASDTAINTTPLVPQQRYQQQERFLNRRKLCIVGSCAVVVSALTCAAYVATRPSHTPEHVDPTLPPTPIYTDLRHGFKVTPFCNAVCTTPVERRDMCAFKTGEWSKLKQDVLELCNNGTAVEETFTFIMSPYPLPPCQTINATLQEVTATCTHSQPNATQIAYRNKMKILANLRKPARVRNS